MYIYIHNYIVININMIMIMQSKLLFMNHEYEWTNALDSKHEGLLQEKAKHEDIVGLLPAAAEPWVSWLVQLCVSFENHTT